MKKKYVFLSILFVLIFIRVVYSQVSVDPNVKSDEIKREFDSTTDTVTIRDKDTNVKIIDLQLTTPNIFNVIDKGEGILQQVAEIKFDNYNKLLIDLNALKIDDFDNFNISFEDLNSNTNIDRDFVFKYKKITDTITKPIFKNICIPTLQINGSVIRECSDVKIGDRVEDIFEWVDFTSFSELPNSEVDIGIFTDVKKGDKVEWVPENWFGVNIPEWAVWISSFNDGLVAYYKLNESSGSLAVESVNGIYNFTNSGNWTEGLINGSYWANGSESSDMNLNLTTLGHNFTINFWINRTGNMTEILPSDGSVLAPILYQSKQGATSTGGGSTQDLAIMLTRTNRFEIIINNSNFADITTAESKWIMVTITSNITHSTVYLNGTRYSTHDNPFAATNPFNSSVELCLFTITNFTGRCLLGKTIQALQASGPPGNTSGVKIDELGFWNRTLEANEISDLYNEGAGLTYDTSFNPTTVTINFPQKISGFKNYSRNDLPFNFNVSIVVGSSSGSVAYSLDNGINNISMRNTTNQNNLIGVAFNHSNNSLSDGTYTFRAFANSTGGGTNFTENVTFRFDGTFALINITEIRATNGSQTILFNHSFIEVNPQNCLYAVYTSSGSIDVINTSVGCGTNNTQFVVSAFSTFNLILGVNDTAGNYNQTNKTFTIISNASGEGSPGGGGGDSGSSVSSGGSPGKPIIINVGSINWSLETDVGSNSYQLEMTKGGKRIKELRFKNFGLIDLNITLSCRNIENHLCQYISFKDSKIDVPVQKQFFVTTIFTIELPETIDETQMYIANIIATDQEGNFAILTTKVHVGKLGFLLEKLSKIIKVVKIGNIPIPILLISIFVGAIIFGLLLITKIPKIFNFMIAFVIAAIALIFIPVS